MMRAFLFFKRGQFINSMPRRIDWKKYSSVVVWRSYASRRVVFFLARKVHYWPVTAVADHSTLGILD
jgi:hypothetical protein